MNHQTSVVMTEQAFSFVCVTKWFYAVKVKVFRLKNTKEVRLFANLGGGPTFGKFLFSFPFRVLFSVVSDIWFQVL